MNNSDELGFEENLCFLRTQMRDRKVILDFPTIQIL